jgi:predicted DNA-binding transcriptional regulator AlpA
MTLEKELLRIPEAARLLGISTKAARQLVKNKVLPTIPGPRRPFVSRRQLLAWLEGRV